MKLGILTTLLTCGLFISLSACQSRIPIVTKSRSASDDIQKNGEKERGEEQARIEGRNKEEVEAESVAGKPLSKGELVSYCIDKLSSLPGQEPESENLKVVCNQVEILEGCRSQKGEPIFHYDRLASDKRREKRILTLALIHGDEGASGTVARSWMQRLERLDPRNRWRVLPITNPDGFLAKTRVNANGVDLNRNFPTRDWEQAALKRWREKKKSDPRKYPGSSPASEKETQCLVSHLKDFDPDFIISIHTPYGVLDFDGPPMNFPQFKPLPWISLGNYPGSLGRYMWVDKNTPVLTIELKGESGVNQLERFDKLQDISGTVAIQSSKILKINKNQKAVSKK